MPIKWTRPKKAEKESKRTTASAPNAEEPKPDKPKGKAKGKAKGKKEAK